MQIENGFILLSRNIIEHDIFASEKMLKVFIWLLAKANYKTRKVPVKRGRGQSIVTLKRGEVLFGRHKAESELFIDGSTIYKIIKRLEKLEVIKIKSNSYYSIITICNYDTYQTSDNYQVTGKSQVSNSQVTGKSQVSNTTKKDNNDKKDNKENNNIEFDYKNIEPETWQVWREYKKTQFKFTYKSISTEQTAINQLVKLSENNNAIAELIVNQSIAAGWKGLFQLKNNEPQKQLSGPEKIMLKMQNDYK